MPIACIKSVGAVTPIGLNAEQTCAAARAGVSAYEESSIMNKSFRPMTMALLPDDALPALDEAVLSSGPLTARERRMLRLAHPALEEVMSAGTSSEPIALFLAGPAVAAGARPPVGQPFLQNLMRQSGIAIDLEASRTYPYCRAGGLLAARDALACLQTGEHSEVLFGGVDSFLDLMLLATLDQADRVLAEGAMNAFAPGEAAAFMMLSTDATHGAVQVHEPGLANEPGHRFSEAPYQGDGLTQAVGDALKALDGQAVNAVFSSLNGENFGAKEWGVAATRNSGQIPAELVFEHPADCYGDVGAASAPLLSVLAESALRLGQLDGPAMVYCSSDAAPRGAVCLSKSR